MPEAKKVNKDIKDLTTEERKDLVEKEISEALAKYNFQYSIEMVYSRQGIVNRLMLVDLLAEEKRDEETIKE